MYDCAEQILEEPGGVTFSRLSIDFLGFKYPVIRRFPLNLRKFDKR